MAKNFHKKANASIDCLFPFDRMNLDLNLYEEGERISAKVKELSILNTLPESLVCLMKNLKRKGGVKR